MLNEGAPDVRVRITTHRAEGSIMWSECELSRKSGKGLQRIEEMHSIDEPIALMLLDVAHSQLQKIRYTDSIWEVDAMLDNLNGVVVLERELKSTDEKIELPSWAVGAIEMTDRVSNKDLAQHGMTLTSLLRMLK